MTKVKIELHTSTLEQKYMDSLTEILQLARSKEFRTVTITPPQGLFPKSVLNLELSFTG